MQSRCGRFFKNSKGITFVEVVASMALLGIMMVPISLMIMNVIYINTKAFKQIETNSIKRIATERLREAVVKKTNSGFLPDYASYSAASTPKYSYTVGVGDTNSFVGVEDYFGDSDNYRLYKYKVNVSGSVYNIDIYRNEASSEIKIDSVNVNVK